MSRLKIGNVYNAGYIMLVPVNDVVTDGLGEQFKFYRDCCC